MSAGTVVGALACQRDSFLRTFKTVVLSCSPLTVDAKQEDGKKLKKSKNKSNDDESLTKPLYEVELEDTILFPEGGGQPGDQGFLIPENGEEKIHVLDVQRKNLRAIHIVDKPIEKDLKVEVEIDWRRRLDHMQQHTGQHLLSAILDKYELPTLSWNLGDVINYIEIPRKLTEEEITDINQEINDEIFKNTAIEIDVPKNESINDDKGVLRVVKIGNLDENPCCGTHLSSIGQIKGVAILGQINGKNGSSKINFVTGDRIFKFTRNLYDVSKKLMNTLSSDLENLPAKAETLAQQAKKGQNQIRNLNKEIASMEADKILQSIEENADKEGRVYQVYREDGDLEFINKIYGEVKDKLEASSSTILLIAGNDKDGAVVAGGPKTESIIGELKKRIPLLRGGGRKGPGGKYQGKAVFSHGELAAVKEYMVSLG